MYLYGYASVVLVEIYSKLYGIFPNRVDPQCNFQIEILPKKFRPPNLASTPLGLPVFSVNMHPHLFPTIKLSLMIVTITLIHFPTSLLADNEQYPTCEAPFYCGNLVNLSYPFWGSYRPNYCGHPSFQLDCSSNVAQINITNINYWVLQIINSSRILKVARTYHLESWELFCPAAFVNTSIDNNLFSYIPSVDTNLTLYYNSSTPLDDLPNIVSLQFGCDINSSTESEFISYYVQTSETSGSEFSNLTGACDYWVKVPVLQSAVTPATYNAVIAAIDNGFMLGWDASNSECDTCLKAGGLCGSDPTTSSFACHCSNGTFPSGCSTVTRSKHLFLLLLILISFLV